MAINMENIKKIINLELFETVMGLKVDRKFISVQENDIWYGYISSKDECKISINDFFFKCKDYALVHGFMINSFTKSNKEKSAIGEIYFEDDDVLFKKFGCNMDSEQEAVFRCCEWVINNTKVILENNND